MTKRKFRFRLQRFVRQFFVNRKYKDALFRRVFEDKEDLLDLYNAINHTHYTNPEELEITTLEGVIYLSMKNDLSFIVDAQMNLYEHQSTFNPNMPIRGFLYFARLYEVYIKKHNLNIYGSRRIELPRPQYIVFFNGRQEQPDECFLKLSDCFQGSGKITDKEKDSPVLECTARMLNINLGHNEELMRSCRRLWEYASFVEYVNENLVNGYSVERAVKQAIDVCIQKDILKDILIASKSEVLHMLLEEYDEKLHLADTFAEGVEHGLERGIERGLMQGKRQAVLELLEEYGEVPMDLELMILGESSDEVLKYWHRLAAKVTSMEEFRQKMYP